jgi:NAD(P)-dependent dehydrogenase (short-subunit alcohol dehydrogenase family)
LGYVLDLQFFLGCSKGIGWGLVKEFLNNTNARVIATTRSVDSEPLQSLREQFDESRLIILRLDVTKDDEFEQVKEELCNKGINCIDILIGNAGISSVDHPHNPFMQCSREDMIQVFNTNVVGNMKLLQTFHDFLNNSRLKLAVLMTSSLGSYTHAAEKAEGSTVAYRVSKAALNMLAVLFATDPSSVDNGVKTMIVHPGHVKTDMGLAGGQEAKLDIEESADGLLALVEKASCYQVSKLSEASKVAGEAKDVQEIISFKHDVEEIESSEKLNEFVTHLDENRFAFVRYDGCVLPW